MDRVSKWQFHADAGSGGAALFSIAAHCDMAEMAGSTAATSNQELDGRMRDPPCAWVRHRAPPCLILAARCLVLTAGICMHEEVSAQVTKRVAEEGSGGQGMWGGPRAAAQAARGPVSILPLESTG